jgi:hypothetical protein
MVCTVVVLTGLVMWRTAYWWIPRCLPVVAERYGVEIKSLVIDSEGKWQVQYIAYQYNEWLVIVEGVEMQSPLHWLWAAWRQVPRPDGCLQVEHLFVQQMKCDRMMKENEVSDELGLAPVALWQQLEFAHIHLQRWLPPARLATFTFQGQSQVPPINGSDWLYTENSLIGYLSMIELAPEMSARVHVGRAADATWEFSVQVEGDYAGWQQPLEGIVFNATVYLRESGFFLRHLSGRGPWFQAQLSNPLQIDFRGPAIEQDARLELELDLSGQCLLPLKGQFKGWFDFSAGVLDITGGGGLGFGGQLRNLVHVEFPEYMADVSGSGSWDGNHANASGDLTVHHERATFKSRISVNVLESIIAATIESASLESADLPKIELTEPLSLRLPQTLDREWEWRLLELDPLLLTAAETASHLRVEWQPAASLFVSVHQLPLKLLSPWIEIPELLKELQVERFILRDFDWDEGLRGSMQLALSIASVEWQQSPFSTRAELSMQFSEDGLCIDNLEWTAGEEAFASGALHLPLQFFLFRESSVGWVQLIHPAQWEGSLELKLPSWGAEWLEELTGVTQGQSSIAFNVEGEGEAVVVRLDIAIANMRMPGRKGIDNNALVAERVALSLRADRSTIVLEQAIVEWSGGRLEAVAELPVEALWESDDGAVLEGLRRGEWLDALSADVNLHNFRVAFWQDLLPPMVRPDGLLEGHFTMRPGRIFSGELIARDFALRPTLVTQAVEAIEARLLLDGTRIIVQDAGASVGGSVAKLEGYIDFAKRDQLEWLVQLSGDNLPLVRTVDMLLRADLDLRFKNNARGEFEPLLVGKVNLKPSSLWIQFDPLAPRPAGRVRGPEPPFFELQHDFLQHWQLDIQLSGNRFLRVRNPWFAAEMSASFLLSGTLGQPLLTGALILESGILRMPAMNMRFDRGEIFITPEEANAMQLELSATGQRANHVITVDARGTVRNPQLQFRAIPDLTQGQILRILTTGGLEGTGAANLGLYLGRGLVGSTGVDSGIADRIQFDYGRSVSNSGRNTLDAEWMLTERLYLRGQYDEYDAYNLDFLWRLLRR